jgi:hypothetical protein
VFPGGIVFLIAGLAQYFGPASGRGLSMIILGSISKTWALIYIINPEVSYISVYTWKLFVCNTLWRLERLVVL